MEINGSGSNPKDPIPILAPDNAAHLLREFGKAAHNFAMKDVVDAAGSMVITALRQRFETRAEADAAFTEIFGRMKQALLDHYDGAHRRKKGIFVYDQTISAGLVTNRPKFLG